MKSILVLSLVAVLASSASAAVLLDDTWTIPTTFGWCTTELDTTSVSTGANSLKVTMNGDGSGYPGLGLIITPATTVVADGSELTLSFDYMIDASKTWGSTLGLQAGFLANDWGGAYLPGLGGSYITLTADSQWHTATITGTPAAGTALSFVKFYRDWWSGQGGADYGTINLDNVQVTPEPATMSVLGLGALLAMRRRRAA